MILRIAVGLFFAGLMVSCGGDGDSGEETTFIQFPHTVTLKAEQALVARTGQVFDTPDFLQGDIVTYKDATIKISSGCPQSAAHCHPLHVCKPAPGSKPTIFTSFQEVCANRPQDGETSNIANAQTGMGFTVRLNTEDGPFAKVFVKEVSGAGPSASVTLTYSILE